MQRFTERNSTVRLPSDMYHSVMKYRRIVGEYMKMYNRDPSDYELRGLLDVSWEELTRIQEMQREANKKPQRSDRRRK